MSDDDKLTNNIDYPWYCMVPDESLQQGDFVWNLPCLSYDSDFGDEFAPETTPIDASDYNVIVLSQSCDLKGRKLRNVLICPFFTAEQYKEQNPNFKPKTELSTVLKGRQAGLHLLEACKLPDDSEPFLLVDFQQAMTVPLALLEHQAKKNLCELPSSRIRLLPPYREHLAQAFGRFIMRIGLPKDIDLSTRHVE